MNIAFTQECNVIVNDVNKAIQLAQQNIENKLNSSSKPDYIETYIIYPVISRYYNKTKNKDTTLIRKFDDFSRAVWCFNGTCFGNNKYFYLNRNEIIQKINNNEFNNNYHRETICMLCDKYNLDTNSFL